MSIATALRRHRHLCHSDWMFTMNQDRRRRIARVLQELERILEEEEEAFENLSEAALESARGERMQEVIDFLHEAIDALQDLLNA